MNWPAFYLTCFAVGFILSFVSFLSGALHFHLPFKMHHHVGHVGAGGHGAHGKGTARGGWFNAASLLAFLAWFGGVGYLLTIRYRFWFLITLGLATLAGIIGASFVSWFFVKVLLKHETILDEDDYRLEGIVASVNVPIRAGGTGEIVYTQGGVRRSAGARCVEKKPLEKGAEVVITHYEKGIAYVRLWDEFTK
jgi:membrane protein implicated in regulation of membrane protease activity